MINQHYNWIEISKESATSREKAEYKKELKSSSLTESSKSSTTLLCEITRLKTQQKFLEHNHIKLNFNNHSESNTVQSLMLSTAECNQSLKQDIMKINLLNTQLDKNLQTFCEQSQIEVQNIVLKMKQIKEYLKPRNLNDHSVGKLRGHIIEINTDIEKLYLQNSNELKVLQSNIRNLYNGETTIKI